MSSATTESANISFSGLPAGTYRLRVTLPERYGYSARKTRSSSLTENMMSQSTDRTQTGPDMVLAAGDSRECGVAAMPLSGISGIIWLDVNGDGVQNNEELGLSGATVEMAGTRNGLTYSCVTDSTGLYEFTQLKPGSYTLKVTLPDGYIFTCKAASGTSSLFTDEGESFGKDNYNLNDPQMLTGQNIGAVPAASLTMRCFVDSNHNGLWDEGESACGGMKVELCHDNSSNAMKTQTSGKDGLVTFTGLRNGTYRVRATVPESTYDFTLVVDGGNCMADEDSRNATLRGVVVGVGEAPELTVGVVKPGSISGYLYKDTNYSGTKDSGDSAASYVKVNLLDTDGNIVDTTKSKKDGSYEFTKVYPGTYMVSFVTSSKFGFLTSGKGTSVATYADGVGTTAPFELTLSEKKTGVNAAMIEPCTVTTRVWADANNNGQYDSGETGLTNATVVL